jgi:hypothetical protein
MQTRPERCNVDRDYSCESPRVLFSDGGRYLRLSFSRSPGAEWNAEQFGSREHKRGICRGFTFGSRRRMLDRLNQVSVGADLPEFVTLTLPDDSFDDSVTKFAKTAKLHLDTLLKRLRRVCPSATGFWRIEWKARKSGLHEGKLFPHFHLLVWGLPQRYDLDRVTGLDVRQSVVAVRDSQRQFAGLCSTVAKQHVFSSQRAAEKFTVRRAIHEVRCKHFESSDPRSFMTFFDWVSLAWYHVVGSHNVDHFLAGCRVESIRSWGGVLSYCAKYMSKADSENFLADVAFGRSWGIFNRSLMPWAKMIELPLADDVGVRLRRIACRYLSRKLGRRVQRHYGITLYCDVAQFKRLLEASPPDTPF